MTPSYAPLAEAKSDLVTYEAPDHATTTVSRSKWPAPYRKAVLDAADPPVEAALHKYRNILARLPKQTRVGDPAVLLVELGSSEDSIVEAEQLQP